MEQHMNYALDRFEQQVRDAIIATGKLPPLLVDLTSPKPNIPADLAFPTFRAAKELRVPPQQLAQELAGAVTFGDDALVGGVAAAGPFLNFTLHVGRLTAAVLEEIERLGIRYGHDDQGAGKTVIVEYSSPNVARRMHVGHIRTTIIGQALFNILSALGYHTISDNHLGDWGKQFGVLIMAVVRERKPEGADEETLAGLEQLYTKYNTLTESDPAADDEARSWSLRLEQGEPQARAIWQWIVDLTMRYTTPLYERLGAHFDTVHGESFFEDKMEPIIAKAQDEGVATRDEKGALVVDLPGLPTFLLQRTDGGTLYLTRDVATVAFREHEYHPHAMIYVVDARQELHFRQVFALARALGLAKESQLVHITYGIVSDARGEPLSTRKGNMVYLQALLDDARQRARAVVEQSSPDLPKDEKDEVAEIVGVGSVIYNDLYQDPRRNITLDWERMLALEGNSAPYIQYMYARCRSILRKAAEEDQRRKTNDQKNLDVSDQAAKQGTQPSSLVLGRSSELLTHPSETAVIKQLAKLPAAVREAGARYAPFVVAEWCYETARALSGFYRDCPVLKAETPELRAARLRLVAATAQALRNGLGLLGLRAPERM
jgi:arginyl-tRNA synthetase